MEIHLSDHQQWEDDRGETEMGRYNAGQKQYEDKLGEYAEQ